MTSLYRSKMIFSEIPLWVGGQELRPGDLILVNLGRLLGERRVEYFGIYSEPISGLRGILGRVEGKVLPLGGISIFRRKVTRA